MFESIAYFLTVIFTYASETYIYANLACATA